MAFLSHSNGLGAQLGPGGVYCEVWWLLINPACYLQWLGN